MTTVPRTCASCDHEIAAHKDGGVETVGAGGAIVTVCDSQCRIELSYDDDGEDTGLDY